MIQPTAQTLRPARADDETRLEHLLRGEFYVHRHLDWRPGLAWLGQQPFWLLENHGQAVATLACPPDPENIYWVRLFAAASSISPGQAWRWLFEQVRQSLAGRTPTPVISVVALRGWLAEVLRKNGFQHHQDIVVLGWNDLLPAPRPPQPGLSIRPALPQDLPALAELDALAFEPIWRHSLETLQLAYQQAAYTTVAEQDGQIAGYQLSTSSAVTTHLARLAVHPGAQRHGIGFALLNDLFAFHRGQGSWQLTVNTQSNNAASLALYQATGFELTGERFPVFLYDGPF